MMAVNETCVGLMPFLRVPPNSTRLGACVPANGRSKTLWVAMFVAAFTLLMVAVSGCAGETRNRMVPG